MRLITYHKINPANERLDIEVRDEPGAGGASHEYAVTHANSAGADDLAHISFQNGPISESGVNGVTQEILLAIVIDRLRSFQAGPFSCRENALALTKCEEALLWLNNKTRERVARGVEGKTAA